MQRFITLKFTHQADKTRNFEKRFQSVQKAAQFIESTLNDSALMYLHEDLIADGFESWRELSDKEIVATFTQTVLAHSNWHVEFCFDEDIDAKEKEEQK